MLLGFVKAIRARAPNFINTRQMKLWRLFLRLYFGSDRAVYREALLHSIGMFSETGKMPVGGPEAVRKVLAASLESVRKANFDLEGTYTNEFVTGQ